MLDLILSQNGKIPNNKRNAGRKIAKVAKIAPPIPSIDIPIYEANVNNGPGTA